MCRPLILSSLTSASIIVILLTCPHTCVGQSHIPVTPTDSVYLKEIAADIKWRTYCICCMDTVRIRPEFTHKYEYKYFLFGELDLVCEVGKDQDNHIMRYFGNKKIIKSCGGQCYPILSNDTSTAPHLSRRDGNGNFFIPGFNYSKQVPGIPVEFGFDYAIYSTDTFPARRHGCRIDRAKKILFDPFQPDIIQFVRENAGRLNPWFLNEARKRGMFDSVKYPPTWVATQAAIEKRRMKECIDLEHN